MPRPAARFLLVTFLALTFAYLLAGGLAYQLLTKPFYVGPDALFTRYLRSEAEPELWAHTMRWQFPMLVLRGVLLAAVLLPFRAVLAEWSLLRRAGVLAALFFVTLHLAAAAPSPSNLEGVIYLRPELLTVRAFLLTQPEMIAQSLLAAFAIAKWAFPKPSR